MKKRRMHATSCLVAAISALIHWIDWEIPKWLGITIMLVLFAGSAIYAIQNERKETRGRRARKEEKAIEDATELLK